MDTDILKNIDMTEDEYYMLLLSAFLEECELRGSKAVCADLNSMTDRFIFSSAAFFQRCDDVSNSAV